MVDESRMKRSTLMKISGILLIAASMTSLILGILLLNSYRSSLATLYYIYYSALTGGILNLVAFPFELLSGALLLRQKSVRLTVILNVAIIVIGLASPIILHFEGYFWETGLLFGSPMIIFSIAALTFEVIAQKTDNSQIKR